MITIEQIRGARAMLGLKQQGLAQKANLSTGTLNNIERGVQTDPKISTLKAIQHALEKEGIVFKSDNEGGVGVFLQNRTAAQDKPVIMIVDDNKADRALYKKWLKNSPHNEYELVEAIDAQGAIEAYEHHEPDCIILDFMMFGTNGFQLLAMLKGKEATLPPIIFVTGSEDKAVENDAKSAGVFDYFIKQRLTQEALNESINQALIS